MRGGETADARDAVAGAVPMLIATMMALRYEVRCVALRFGAVRCDALRCEVMRRGAVRCW